ncbi:hypothetical protein R1flu_016353 [Riccia fluitans]|uniref:Uncharacterized protein n=1 Tax=Riccia fluitans TaxID=41844 RepID=A0ABD1YLL4_9MARC
MALKMILVVVVLIVWELSPTCPWCPFHWYLAPLPEENSRGNYFFLSLPRRNRLVAVVSRDRRIHHNKQAREVGVRILSVVVIVEVCGGIEFCRNSGYLDDDVSFSFDRSLRLPSQVKFKFCSTESGTRCSVINTLKGEGYAATLDTKRTPRRRLWNALQRSGTFPGPIPEPMNFARTMNHGVPAPATNYQSEMEEGRLNANQPPPRKAPGLGVIMPGEAEVTFIAEPSSPIRTTAKDKTKFDSSMEEEEDSNPVQHPPKNS